MMLQVHSLFGNITSLCDECFVLDAFTDPYKIRLQLFYLENMFKMFCIPLEQSPTQLTYHLSENVITWYRS